LGAHNISRENEFGSVRKDVEDMTVHENWDPTAKSYNNDIALIKLESSVEFSRFIQPICLLPPNNSEIFSHGKLTAWRAIDDDKNLAEFPRTEEVEILVGYDCLYPDSIPQSFCARSDFVGVCEDISGSGLVVKIGDRHFLKGLVLFSSKSKWKRNKCNGMIYSDMQKYYNFIKVRNEDFFNPF
jgi:hypothetical protein